jgi:hypothetical protein
MIPRLLRTYLPTPEVYKHAFYLEASTTSSSFSSPSSVEEKMKKSRDLVESIFRQWRDSSGGGSSSNNNGGSSQRQCKEEATFAWCIYLLGLGGSTNIKGASTAMSNYLAGMEPGEKARVESKWRKVLDGDTEKPGETGEMEDDTDKVGETVDEDVDMDGGASENNDDEEIEDDEDVEFVVVG